MWITEYEQTMIYPASLLSPQHWLSAGWSLHLRAWLNAAVGNFQTALAVQGSIVLFPFMLTGLWKLRGRVEVQLGAGMWLLTAVILTIAFPYAGVNGSFFHSGTALQPFLWAVAPLGFETALAWYARQRRFGESQQIFRFMGGLLVAVCLLLSGGIYFQRVVGSNPAAWQWSADAEHYQAVEVILQRHGALPGEAVLVKNPPAYWLASRRPAAVVPYGDEQVLLEVARKYGIQYLVLEISNPWQLVNLYEARVNPPELEYLEAAGSTRLYRIRQIEE